MANNVALYITGVMVLVCILCSINISSYKKNYNKFLYELKNSNSKYENELEMLMKYINKQFQMQEASQSAYVMAVILALAIFFYNM